jgi:chromosome segregation ATPase
MKLLKKSETKSIIEAERKAQVDDGARIASKVDALRKSLSDLEAQHAELLRTSPIEIESALKPLKLEKAEIEADIRRLEESRKELMKPIDSIRKEAVTARLKAEEHERKASSEFLRVRESREEYENMKKDLDSQMRSLALRIRKIDSSEEKAKATLERAENALESAQVKLDDVETYSKSKRSQLASREAILASEERELRIAEKQLAIREKEIINKRILLEDREATLEREIKRQQNKWQQ